MEIIPLGDSALVLRVREQFEDAPEETLNEVLRVFELLQRAAIPGVIELAPAYTSVAVFFDPITIAKAREKPDDVFDWLASRIRGVLAAGADRRRKVRSRDRNVEIAVCYDSQSAPDIDDVARHTQLPA